MVSWIPIGLDIKQLVDQHVLLEIRASRVAPRVALAGFGSDPEFVADPLVHVLRHPLGALHAQTMGEIALAVFAGSPADRRCADPRLRPIVTIWKTATSRRPVSSGRK